VKRRLTKEEWVAARRRWEGAPEDGVAWLVKEISAAWGVELSRPAVRQMLMKQEWKKGGEPSSTLAATGAQPPEVARKVSAGKSPRTGKQDRKVSDAESAPPPVIVPPPNARRRSIETGLTAEEEQFATRIALKEEQAPAYRAVYQRSINWDDASVRSVASRLAAEPRIQARVQALLAHAARENEADVSMVLGQYLQRMRADPRELTALHVAPCRYCWGTNHLYQFTDGELEDKRTDHEEKRQARLDAGRTDIGAFRERGGGGYSVLKEPNPVCPSCGGAGLSRVILKDSRKYSPAALSLFEGVKQTEKGIEVKTTARADMLAHVARHVGFYAEDKEPPVTVNIDMRALDDLYQAAMEKAKADAAAAKGRSLRFSGVQQEGPAHGG
jgi:phage terminase small subunit